MNNNCVPNSFQNLGLQNQTYEINLLTPRIKVETSEVWESFCEVKDEIDKKCELNLNNVQTKKEEPLFEADDLNISGNKTNLAEFFTVDEDNTHVKTVDDFKFSPMFSSKEEWQENSVKMEIIEDIDEKVNDELFQDTKIQITENPLYYTEINNTMKYCSNKKNSSDPTAKPLFECQECHKKFTQKYNLHSHIVSKHSDNEEAMNTVTYEVYSCEICKKYKTLDKSKFKIHSQTHKGVEAEKNFHCTMCDYKTFFKGNLIKHVMQKHTDLRIFRCRYCNKSFKLKRQLDSHILSKHSKDERSMFDVTSKVYSCNICKYKTIYQYRLDVHLQKHKAVDSSKKKIKKFICAVCDFETKKKANLEIHIFRKHSDSLPFDCQNCNKKFKFKPELDRHIVSKHSDNERLLNTITRKVIFCGICEFKTLSKSTLKLHLQIHERAEVEKIYPNVLQHSMKVYCSRCDYKTRLKYNLDRHVLHKHTDLRPFHCQGCIKTYKSKRELDFHIFSKHSDNETVMNTMTSKIHSCGICEFKTIIKSHFTTHLQKHEGVVAKKTIDPNASQHSSKNFYCNICDYKTILKTNLKRHIMDKHTDLRPFHCQNCDKTYKSKFYLDGHILSKHSDNEQAMNTVTSKIHFCKMCEFKTVVKCYFKSHLRTHEGEEVKRQKHTNLRPFHCQDCNKKYKSKCGLDGHILLMHSDNEKMMNTITSKIHSCGICEYRTVIKSYFKSHLRTHEERN